MGYTENFKSLMKSINAGNRLNYFKSELLKVLDNAEKKEDRLSKAIQDYFVEINKSLYGISIEKGRVGTIGEIRTWKDGKKYKKMPNGKWVRVYQQQNRSAEISIARLKGRVKNAKSVDELLQIVMANVHRFEDENGQILPIVEELKKEVAASKGKLNAGKPTTQQQIDDFKEKNKKKDRFVPEYVPTNGYGVNEYMDSITEGTNPADIKVGDYFMPSAWSNNKRPILQVAKINVKEDKRNDYTIYTFTDQYGETHIVKRSPRGGALVAKIKDNVEFERNEVFDMVDRYNAIMEEKDPEKAYKELQEFKKEFVDLYDSVKEKYRKAKESTDINGDDYDKIQGDWIRLREIDNELDTQTNRLYWLLPEQQQKIQDEEKEAEKVYYQYFYAWNDVEGIEDLDKKHNARLQLIKEIKKQIDKNNVYKATLPNRQLEYKWEKCNYDLEKMIDRIKHENELENNQRNSVKENAKVVTTAPKYTAEEIKEASEKAEAIKPKTKAIQSNLVIKRMQYNQKKRELWGLSFGTDEYNAKLAECDALEEKIKEYKSQLKAYSEELDNYMDKIVDNLINREYAHDTKVDNMTNSQDVADYMNNDGFFIQLPGEKAARMEGFDIDMAKRSFNMFEKFFSVMNLKGMMEGIHGASIGDNTYAQVHYNQTSVECNNSWFSKSADFDKQFKKDIESNFHPAGPTESIVIHELGHAVINYITRATAYANAFVNYDDISKAIKEKVLKQYKVKGMKRNDVIKTFGSDYATKNQHEFIAEFFARGMVGAETNNIARGVVRELVKCVNYMGGIYI